MNTLELSKSGFIVLGYNYVASNVLQVKTIGVRRKSSMSRGSCSSFTEGYDKCEAVDPRNGNVLWLMSVYLIN